MASNVPLPRKVYQPLVEIPGQGVAPASNARYSPSQFHTQRLTPQNTTKDFWYQQASVADFHIKNFNLDVVEHWVMRFCTNWTIDDADWDGGDFTLYINPAVFLIDHLEVHVNGNKVESIPNYALWQAIKQTRTQSQGEALSFFEGYTVSVPNPLTSAANPQNGYSLYFPNIGVGNDSVVYSPSKPVYLDLHFRTLLEKCSANWHILSEDNDIMIRIYSNNSAATWSFGTYTGDDPDTPVTAASPHLFRLELYAMGVQLSENERRTQMSVYREKGLSVVTTAIKSIAIPVKETIAAGGTSTELVLNGIDGTITQLVAYVATTPQAIASAVIFDADEQTLLTPSNLGVGSCYASPFTLIDQNGMPVNAPDMPQDIALFASVLTNSACPFQFLLITYNFNTDARASLEKGEVSGGIFFNNWRLRFTNAYSISGDPLVNPNVYCSLYQLTRLRTEPGTGLLRVNRM